MEFYGVYAYQNIADQLAVPCGLYTSMFEYVVLLMAFIVVVLENVDACTSSSVEFGLFSSANSKKIGFRNVKTGETAEEFLSKLMFFFNFL